MTDAGSRLDHGDAAAFHDMADQPCPAARNEDIQQPREMRHHIHGTALLHCEHLYGSRRNTGGIGSARKNIGNDRVRAQSIRATAQEHSIS